MEEEEGVEEKTEEEADEETGEEVDEETENKAVENNEKEETEKVLLFYQKLNIPAAEYTSINFLLLKLHSTRTFNVMTGKHKVRDNKVDFDFVANEGYTFPDRNIPNILGFRGTETPFGIHIGNEEFAKRRIVVADDPYDLISGINLIFCIH